MQYTNIHNSNSHLNQSKATHMSKKIAQLCYMYSQEYSITEHRLCDMRNYKRIKQVWTSAIQLLNSTAIDITVEDKEYCKMGYFLDSITCNKC